MLLDDDFRNFAKSQLPKDEKILYVTSKQRASSSRISEVCQGCAALFVLVFAVMLLHPQKGTVVMPVTERILFGMIAFALGAIVFLGYCFFLFRKADRRVCVFTDHRIVMFDFEKPIHRLSGVDLLSGQKFRQHDIRLDLIKRAIPVGQKDRTGVLVLDVFDSAKKNTWYNTQIEVGDVESIKKALPKSVLPTTAKSSIDVIDQKH